MNSNHLTLERSLGRSKRTGNGKIMNTLQDLAAALLENKEVAKTGYASVHIMAFKNGTVSAFSTSGATVSVDDLIGDINADTHNLIIAKQDTTEGKKAHREQLLAELNALNAELGDK